MTCKACGFEFDDSLPLCPKCAEHREEIADASEGEASGSPVDADDPAKILDAVGEKLGGIASSVRKYAGEAGENLGSMAGRAGKKFRRYAGEAGENLEVMAGRAEEKFRESGGLSAIKARFLTPKTLIAAGAAFAVLVIAAALFGSPGNTTSRRFPSRGIRGNISSTDGKNTYILDIANYQKGSKNTLYILTKKGSRVVELDVPVIANVDFGVVVNNGKIYYKDDTENAEEHPFCVYDLDAGKNYVLFDENEGVVGFTSDDAGLYANKADGSFIMLPHGK